MVLTCGEHWISYIKPTVDILYLNQGEHLGVFSSCRNVVLNIFSNLIYARKILWILFFFQNSKNIEHLKLDNIYFTCWGELAGLIGSALTSNQRLEFTWLSSDLNAQLNQGLNLLGKTYVFVLCRNVLSNRWRVEINWLFHFCKLKD